MLQTHSPYDLLQGSHSQDSYCGGRGQNSLHEATPEQGGFSMVYTQEVSQLRLIAAQIIFLLISIRILISPFFLSPYFVPIRIRFRFHKNVLKLKGQVNLFLLIAVHITLLTLNCHVFHCPFLGRFLQNLIKENHLDLNKL